jgi:hypothetical protein
MMEYNNNISFNELYILIIRAKEVVTKRFHSWNDRDYSFLKNDMGLEKPYCVKLVKKINNSNSNKKQFLQDYIFLNGLAVKYLKESNVGKNKINISYTEYQKLSEMIKYDIIN